MKKIVLLSILLAISGCGLKQNFARSKKQVVLPNHKHSIYQKLKYKRDMEANIKR